MHFDVVGGVFLESGVWERYVAGVDERDKDADCDEFAADAGAG